MLNYYEIFKFYEMEIFLDRDEFDIIFLVILVEKYLI